MRRGKMSILDWHNEFALVFRGSPDKQNRHGSLFLISHFSSCHLTSMEDKQTSRILIELTPEASMRLLLFPLPKECHITLRAAPPTWIAQQTKQTRGRHTLLTPKGAESHFAVSNLLKLSCAENAFWRGWISAFRVTVRRQAHIAVRNGFILLDIKHNQGGKWCLQFGLCVTTQKKKISHSFRLKTVCAKGTFKMIHQSNNYFNSLFLLTQGVKIRTRTTLRGSEQCVHESISRKWSIGNRGNFLLETTIVVKFGSISELLYAVMALGMYKETHVSWKLAISPVGTHR